MKENKQEQMVEQIMEAIQHECIYGNLTFIPEPLKDKIEAIISKTIQEPVEEYKHIIKTDVNLDDGSVLELTYPGGVIVVERDVIGKDELVDIDDVQRYGYESGDWDKYTRNNLRAKQRQLIKQRNK